MLWFKSVMPSARCKQDTSVITYYLLVSLLFFIGNADIYSFCCGNNDLRSDDNNIFATNTMDFMVVYFQFADTFQL